MSLQLALALTMLVGLPLMLLAVGVLAQAMQLSRRTGAADPADAELNALASASVDELVLELHHTIEDLRGQLISQRSTLQGLLSDAAMRRSEALAPAAAPISFQPAPLEAPAYQPSMTPPADLHRAVQQLTAEGLSDRAIARRLHVGLEEVRLVRSNPGTSQW